ncbi:DUF4845 domain-containing protein [Halioglobus maricola]|uniref:DUF4845 domain-containing protein n=1 Tax=Halioglobus maricola TaxID=2601894 RepID=A0A5P9NLY4_9GAMM|nr:DUF4845 domain-containing protein [Halioglobus maricola]QFU76515.1 DUF4845 domain-containing protein [Halioglobus maricola]
MRQRQRQTGIGLFGGLIIAMMAGFYVLCIVKVVPVYSEYESIKHILTTISDEHKPNVTTIGEMRRRLANLFNSNQIKAIKVKDVQFYRKGGKMYIDGRYEGRVNIIANMDLALRFDDLLFVAGQPNIK